MVLKIKSTKVKFILFLIVVSIALVSFTYAITQMLVDKGPSWKNIELTTIVNSNGDKIFPYYGEVKLDYYSLGSKDERNRDLNEVKTEFNYALAEYFMLFDVNNEYKKDDQIIYNLNYINKHPNEEIILHPFLYQSLKDAYSMTIQQDGTYNIFAGELYNYWVKLLDFQDFENDPLTSSAKRIELESLVNLIDDYKNDDFDLIFNDTAKSVIFELKQTYPSKDKIIVDLQFMGQAYVIDGVKDYLIGKGFTKGKLYSGYYGFFATLGVNPETGYGGFWSESVYYPVVTSSEAESLVDIKTPTSYVGCRISDYHVKYNYGLRSVNTLETFDIIRHPFYNAKTGYPVNKYRLVSTFSTDKTVGNIVKNAFYLFNSEYSITSEYIKVNSDANNHFINLVNETANPVNVDKLVIYASKYLKDNGYFMIHETVEFTIRYIE